MSEFPLQVHLVDGGMRPPTSGLYVAYIRDAPVPYANKIILFYEKEWDRWSYPMADARYRGHIYGWIGPLPALKIAD
jgi:hypothetical protein